VYFLYCFHVHSLDEPRVPTSEAQNQMNRGLFLNVVVQQGSPVFQLFSGINEPLLVGRNALLVLYFCLNGVDCISRLDFQRNCFARERFYKDLHLFVYYLFILFIYYLLFIIYYLFILFIYYLFILFIIYLFYLFIIYYLFHNE